VVAGSRGLPASVPLPAQTPNVNSVDFRNDLRAEETISVKCLKEWPNDRRMRAYCEERQVEAVKKLRRDTPANSSTFTIRQHCANEWPDDYRMRVYCEEKAGLR